MPTEDAAEVTATGAEPACPYLGPAVFLSTDAGLFFGRTELVAELVSRLRDHTTLVVAGPSKCGKSSLVRAGLLPAFARGELPGSGEWPQSVFVPGRHPLDALWGALGRLTKEPLPDIFSLEEGPGPAATRLVREGVLCVDQFETLFTAASDPAEREAFLSVLRALHSEQNPRFRLVLDVDTDFYGTCSAIPWLASAISENHLLVGRPSREELREVIEGPARKAGLRLEAGLADRLLKDTESEPAPLAVLSVVLREAWNLRKGRTLTFDGYEQARSITAREPTHRTPGPEPLRASPQPAAAQSASPATSRVPTARSDRAPGEEARDAATRMPPVMLALFLLAVLASLALGILLTQMAH